MLNDPLFNELSMNFPTKILPQHIYSIGCFKCQFINYHQNQHKLAYVHQNNPTPVLVYSPHVHQCHRVCF